MTLAIGDRIGKLHADWKEEAPQKWVRVFPKISRLVEGEMSREFEVTEIQYDSIDGIPFIKIRASVVK